MNDETVTREYHETVVEKKSKCIAELRAERDAWEAKYGTLSADTIQYSFDLGVAKRENDALKETIKRYEDRKVLFQSTIDALRASLRDMTEWAEKYRDSMEDGYSWDGDEKCWADLAKARGLLK